MANNDAVLDLLETILVPAYPRQVIPPETLDVYVKALADIDAGILRAAFVECMTHDDKGAGTWFPAIARIRHYAARIRSGAAAQVTGNDAWGMVRAMLRLPEKLFMRTKDFERLREREGWLAPYEPDPDGLHIRLRTLPDSAERAVRAVGGWTYLRRESENEAADRARFLQAYEGAQAQEQHREEMAPGVRALVDQIVEQKRIKSGERLELEG